MTTKKTIIFDFDGVLVDSFNIGFEVTKLARPTITPERYRTKFDGNIGDAKYEDEEVNKINFFEEYGKRSQSLEIKKEVIELIRILKEKYLLFIVSSTDSSIIKDILNKHNILSYFTEVLGWDIEKSKVVKFKNIFKKYDILPEEAIFITDTSGDVKEAKESLIDFIIGISEGFQDKDVLEKSNPSFITENLSNALNFVRDNF